MAKNLVYIGVIVLAVIAIVLGYKIYQQTLANRATPQTTTPSQQVQTKITPPKITPQPVGTTSQSSTPTAEQLAALNFPGPNATESEKKKHAELVDKMSVISSELNITNCQFSPPILKALQGSSITIRNDGQDAQTLHWGTKDIVIQPTSQKVVNLREWFGNGLGDHGYSCLNSNNPGGIIKIYSGQ